ncbi:MAG TPA: protein-glutamate O-methyltransferase CheR [Solirubrobacteraceae bacterium]|jgi:chemotaxis protein methyltransferase CheR|nr:protein-glutamate O-methyltransferase CheR [Solirubrobacteraceae bacterium]
MTTTAVDDYVEFCTFLRKLTGIDLSQYKRAQMERRLRSFYANKGVDSLTATFERLRSDPVHLEELLDRITINVSQLWRNPEQWEVIKKTLLPELAEQGQIRAWSAGCSYGAEAYTLATLCHVVAPHNRVSIQGTDIDKRMVARARLGLFSEDDARTAPDNLLRIGFDRVDGGWRAKLDLRKTTRFDPGDLLQMQLRRASYDLILCRNTVIYFAEPIRDELHARLAGALRPGGFLVIGSTERVSSATVLGLSMQHPFIYRKS